MKCPHCGGDHPADFKFCPVTGKEIDAHHGMKACSNPDCPDCGKYILPAEAKFCPRCGRPISDGCDTVKSVWEGLRQHLRDDYDTVKPVRSCDSRIVIVCSGYGSFINVGKNRDSKIKLKDGNNIICVSEYPELIYGFSMNKEGHSKRIQKIDLENYDTSQVTDMSMMFARCSSLKSLDLSGFDTSRVTDMSSMFYGCSSLNSLDLSGFDTSCVKNRSMMFYGCPESIQEKYKNLFR